MTKKNFSRKKFPRFEVKKLTSSNSSSSSQSSSEEESEKSSSQSFLHVESLSSTKNLKSRRSSAFSKNT